MQNYEPLFIVGFPRSGTTLLLHIIRSTDAYPTYEFDETHYFSRYYLRYGDLSKARQQRHLLADVTGSDWFRKSGLEAKEFLGSFEGQRITYQAVLRNFMQMIAAQQGKVRWLEKTPWHILYVDEIAECYPTAKFVLLVRDPRSVVQSVWKAGWATGLTRGKLRIAAAWRWHNMLADKKFQAFPDRHLCLRYEDLILNTESVFKVLSEFLGIEIDIKSIQQDKLSALGKSNSSFGDSIVGLSSTPLFRWKDNMDPMLMASIEYLIGNRCMEKYNYEQYAVARPSVPTIMWLRQYYYIYSLMKNVRTMLFPLVNR